MPTEPDSSRREFLSLALDGEDSPVATRRHGEPPTSEDCLASWRGYCITRSVLRGELDAARGVACSSAGDDLANRVRAALDLEPAQDLVAGAPSARDRWLLGALPRRGGSRYGGVSAINTWRSTLRGRGRRARSGAMLAGGAVACSIVLGVTVSSFDQSLEAPGGERSLAAVAVDNDGVVILPSTTAPVAANIGNALPTMPADGGLLAASDGFHGEARSPVPRIVSGQRVRSAGQLPYFFAHANAWDGGYLPSAVQYVPIAGDGMSLSAGFHGDAGSSSGEGSGAWQSVGTSQ